MAISSMRYPTSTLLKSLADRQVTFKMVGFFFASVSYEALLEVNIFKEMKPLMYLTLQADRHCLLTKHF